VRRARVAYDAAKKPRSILMPTANSSALATSRPNREQIPLRSSKGSGRRQLLNFKLLDWGALVTVEIVWHPRLLRLIDKRACNEIVASTHRRELPEQVELVS
jgi:hypothetical protein